MTLSKIASALVVVAITCVAVAGCSDDSAAAQAAAGECPSVGSKECTNDTATTQAQHDACSTAQSNAKCGSKYTALLKCTGSNISCDSDGKSVESASCSSESTAYDACLAGH